MEPYFSLDGTDVAVLVSPGFGAGWSTWNVPELAWDHRVVEWWLDHHSSEYCKALECDDPEADEFRALLKEWGYKGYVYFGGYGDIEMEWVSRKRMWRIEEHHGSESIVFADEQQQWNSF